MSNKEIEISIVSPVYQAEGIVEELVRRISIALEKLTDRFEVILVEDGSSDRSWNKVIAECEKSRNVKGIKLSRNFGQHYAITAGIKEASGDYIVLMDCDLQDDPDNIGLLIHELKSGNDIVFTKRKKRKHSLFKLITAKVYNWLFRLFSDRNYDINFGSLVAFTMKVKIEFLKLKEQDRLYIQLLKWIGFKYTYLELKHHKRFFGESSYSFRKLLRVAIQGWTSYSDKLLRTSIYIGFILGCLSFVGIITIIILYFLKGLQPGWPSVIVTILFSTGLILISLGITGIYIGKIFHQVKHRPLYLVESYLNFDEDSEKYYKGR